MKLKPTPRSPFALFPQHKHPTRDATEDKGDSIDVRHRDGSRPTRKRLRKEGRIPAILFRSGDEQGELLSLPLTDIERLVRKYGLTGVGARMLTLNFEDGTRKESVIAKQLMQDAVTRAVENMTFMPCGPETVVKVTVRVSSVIRACACVYRARTHTHTHEHRFVTYTFYPRWTDVPHCAVSPSLSAVRCTPHARARN